MPMTDDRRTLGVSFEDCTPPDLCWARCVFMYGRPGFRSQVTGAVLRGHMPGEAAQHTNESEPRDMLARQERGLIEVALPFGRADVCTETDVFEVEPFHSWTKGLMQVLAYAAQTGMRPNLALMGKSTSDERVRVFSRLKKRLGTTALGQPCRLWFYGPCGWWEITSVKAAKRVPR